jgi:hypothetical protein
MQTTPLRPTDQMTPQPHASPWHLSGPADASWRERVGREITGLFIDSGELRLVGSVLFTVMFGAIQGSTLDDGFRMRAG